MITLSGAGCDLLKGPSRPDRADEAHIEVTGSSPVPLLLVTSNDWGDGFDELTGERIVVLFQADTAQIDLPHQATVRLAPLYGVLFRVINPDTAQDASIRMRVRLDDELVFDESATMRAASLEYSYSYY